MLLSISLVCACTTPFDVLRAKTEDLGPTLYVRASWKDLWLNLVPRDSYPKGAGYVRSTFQISRSEPATDEETWAAIQSIADTAQGACNLTYNQTYVGMHEDTYKPENFGLMGPLVCQDDLTMYWNSTEFWEKYFQSLEKRNRRSIINRLGNIYRQYIPKASANASFAYHAGDYATQPAPSAVNMTALDANHANLPTSELTQEMLDSTAVELSEEGADEPNSNGWITQGADGPIFPLYIGQAMSHRLLLNNSELRSDFNNSFQGWGDANPVIKRLGASRIIKNFRHVINRFPARWKDGSGGTAGQLVRVPTWVSAAAGTGEKGQIVNVNPDWRDATIAKYEMAEVLSPWVMTEEVLMPVNSAPGMKLHPQNYFGEWTFVTGNDALLGISSCTGIQDPLHKQGRHFAEYRHALKPIFPLYGRGILFRRCANAFDTVTCS